ncbi:hypothetical protein [Luteimonas sp. FCS-9]|uniref:hypothetical protein n=1 Tax=Luteimonas sp. FCS-9 TaxID=1547516 RepID=UPI000A52E4DF|nr:hypothetical protein [Luteimonas sp. FCS-9]
MSGAPARLLPGTVLRHSRFYLDRATGEYKPKFLLVLAPVRGGDHVVRLLTSRHANLRREQPPCDHGEPYPGFYLGVLDTARGLGKKSWLDLRGLQDADGVESARLLGNGTLTIVMQLPAALLAPAVRCVAAADDTTQAQEQALLDYAATL